MHATEEYFPCTVLQSDGQAEITLQDKKKELNQPTEEQRDQRPDDNGAEDFYRPVAHGANKSVDWRRKLGTLLMRIVGGKEHAGRMYILTKFPDGYTLWENSKTSSKSKGAATKKHVENKDQRQDAYLYGHPLGRKKRFRSPAEFIHHLLWLATDATGDSANCTCKICSPDGDIKPAKVEVKSVIEAPVRTAVSGPQVARVLSASTLSAVATAASRPTGNPHESTKEFDQIFDAQPGGKFIYRPGETVWFNNGANWRLGVVSMRNLNNGSPQYQIQPLSNPRQHQPIQIKVQHSLRPWLAWSVPSTTVAQLREMAFLDVPWDRVLRGEFDNNQLTDYIVDGSILAAKAIDASFSVFDIDKSFAVPEGSAAYRGMFLGGEQIWIDEPIRLKATGGKPMVQVLKKIIMNNQTDEVEFRGEIYELNSMPSPYKNESEWPKPSRDLPPRMSTDIIFRNRISAMKNEWSEWSLKETPGKRRIDDIKGRWYESQMLLPILKGSQKYEDDRKLGITSDAGEWMNGRKDNNPVRNTRTRNRKEALGEAVPSTWKPYRTLPVEQVAAVAPPPPQPVPHQQFDMNQYMDLDGSNGYYAGV